jgi:hypothetical protein
MQKKYDAVLYVEQPVNEADKRSVYKGNGPSKVGGFTQYWDTYDPKLYDMFSFGNSLRQSLSSMGTGFSCEVIDFKKWIVATVHHSNMMTGKTSSKTFLIVFSPDKDGIVLSTHNRYRTISGVDQAASYIRSACSALQSDTQNKIG